MRIALQGMTWLLHYKISPKLTLDPNLAESRLPVMYFSVVQSFSNLTQGTAFVLSCAMNNFKTINQQQRMSWTNKVLLDFS